MAAPIGGLTSSVRAPRDCPVTRSANRYRQGFAAASDRDWFFPVAFVEPIEDNERLLGFDISSDRPCREAMDRAEFVDQPPYRPIETRLGNARRSCGIRAAWCPESWGVTNGPGEQILIGFVLGVVDIAELVRRVQHELAVQHSPTLTLSSLTTMLTAGREHSGLTARIARTRGGGFVSRAAHRNGRSAMASGCSPVRGFHEVAADRAAGARVCCGVRSVGIARRLRRILGKRTRNRL